MIFTALFISAHASDGSGAGSGLDETFAPTNEPTLLPTNEPTQEPTNDPTPFHETCYGFCDQIGVGFTDSSSGDEESDSREPPTRNRRGNGAFGSGMDSDDSGDGFGSGMESSSDSGDAFGSGMDSDSGEGGGPFNGVKKQCYRTCDESPDEFDSTWFCYDFCKGARSKNPKLAIAMSSCYNDCDGERVPTKKSRKVKFKSTLRGVTEDEARASGPSVARVLRVPWDTVTVTGVTLKGSSAGGDRRRAGATYDVDYDITSETDSTATALMEATGEAAFTEALEVQIGEDLGITVEVEDIAPATMEACQHPCTGENGSGDDTGGLSTAAIVGIALGGTAVAFGLVVAVKKTVAVNKVPRDTEGQMTAEVFTSGETRA